MGETVHQVRVCFPRLVHSCLPMKGISQRPTRPLVFFTEPLFMGKCNIEVYKKPMQEIFTALLLCA